MARAGLLEAKYRVEREREHVNGSLQLVARIEAWDMLNTAVYFPGHKNQPHFKPGDEAAFEGFKALHLKDARNALEINQRDLAEAEAEYARILATPTPAEALKAKLRAEHPKRNTAQPLVRITIGAFLTADQITYMFKRCHDRGISQAQFIRDAIDALMKAESDDASTAEN